MPPTQPTSVRSRSWGGAFGGRSARPYAAGVAAALVLAAAPARAEGTDDLEALLERPVITTAVMNTDGSNKAPATSTTITADDLRRYGIRTLDEALNYLSLGMVSMNPLHAVEVGARGVLLSSDYGNHVLLLFDGHVANEQWNGTAYYERGAGMPLELIDRVEVVLSPGAVPYGSNAMLGFINVVTKRAKDYSGARVIAEGELFTSFRVAAGVGYEFGLFGKPAEVTAQAEYFGQAGPSFRFGPQYYGEDAVTGEPKRFTREGPATGVWGGVASRSYKSTAPAFYGRFVWSGFEVSARASAYKRTVPYINYINNYYSDFNEPGDYELDRFVSLDAKHKAVLSSRVELRSRLYGDLYQYGWHTTTSAAEDCPGGASLGGCDRKLEGYARWAGIEEQLGWDWLGDGRYVSLVGAEARGRSVAGRNETTDRLSGQGLPAGLNYEHLEHYVVAYAQQSLRPVAWAGLNAGVRAERDQRYGSALQPRLAATYEPWEGTTVKAIYAEAFRAPSAYESYYAEPSTYVAGASLRPERVRSAEASFEQRFGRTSLLFGVFRSWWTDLITAQALTGDEIAAAVARGELDASSVEAYQFRNVATVDNYGFNAAVQGALAGGALRYGLNVTGARARRRDPGGESVPLGASPQFFGNARVSYDLGGGLPIIALAGHFYGQTPTNRAFDGSYPRPNYGPGQIVLRATLSGDMPSVPGLSYRLTATYAAASRLPYAAGPVQYATDQQPTPELAPVDRFRAALGLQYEFGK